MMVISLEDTEAYRRYLQHDDPRHGCCASWHLDFRLRQCHPLEDLGTRHYMT